MTVEPLFAQVVRAPAYRVVGESIRAAILEGRLQPGDVLPGEQDLAERLGVTRSTVREGLRSLEHVGLIERGRRRRLAVALPSERSVGSAMRDTLVLQKITYQNLWEILMALEPVAAALAAGRMTADGVALLRANLARTAEVIDDPIPLVEADVEFHRLVAESAANPALMLARAPLARLFYPAYAEVIRRLAPGRRLMVAHTHIADAIEKGDASSAEAWMSKHIRDFHRGCAIAGIELDRAVDRVEGR